MNPACFIDGEWRPGRGQVMTRKDPVTGDTTWEGPMATPEDVRSAVDAARRAWPAWATLAKAENCKVDAATTSGDDLGHLIGGRRR